MKYESFIISFGPDDYTIYTDALWSAIVLATAQRIMLGKTTHPTKAQIWVDDAWEVLPIEDVTISCKWTSQQ